MYCLVMKKIEWINGNPGGQADERGYWTSVERRFSISPNYRHTIYPDSYTLNDRMRSVMGSPHSVSYQTVRECKAQANYIVAKEHEKDI